jgi:tetratricopeptide (TPR) repeat protein
MRLQAAMVFGLVTLAATSALAAPGAEEINSLFNEACDLYEASEFEGALRIFESLVSGGVRHPAVYYNLANCYYQQGEIGKAVTNYRRARLLSPRDEDVQANLAFLRSSVGFQDTTGAFGLDGIARIPGEIASPKEWRIVFYGAYYLAIMSFLGVLFLGSGARRKALRALAVLTVVAVAGWAIAEHGLSRFTSADEGVVVMDRSEFMSGPGAAFDELARLPDGVEVEIRARSGIWVEVQLRTGDIGWVREENLETI